MNAKDKRIKELETSLEHAESASRCWYNLYKTESGNYITRAKDLDRLLRIEKALSEAVNSGDWCDACGPAWRHLLTALEDK